MLSLSKKTHEKFDEKPALSIGHSHVQYDNQAYSKVK